MQKITHPFYDELIKLNAPVDMIRAAEFKGRNQFIRECKKTQWLIWLAQNKQGSPGWLTVKRFWLNFTVCLFATALLSAVLLRGVGVKLTKWVFRKALLSKKFNPSIR